MVVGGGGIAKRVNPYQTPPVAASDNGLHCLQMSLLCDVWIIFMRLGS